MEQAAIEGSNPAVKKTKSRITHKALFGFLYLGRNMKFTKKLYPPANSSNFMSPLDAETAVAVDVSRVGVRLNVHAAKQVKRTAQEPIAA